MAMGLAMMNAIPGARNGALMIQNNYNRDTDLKDGWSSYSVTPGYDYQDGITLDDKGKLVKRKNSTLGEVKVYSINTLNVDEVLNSLIEEVNLKYEDRPTHEREYLYEVFTNNKLLTEDQFDYDPLLERVYLDRISKQMSGAVDNIETEVNHNLMNNTKNAKDSHYPLEEKPRSTPDEEDTSVNFPLLAEKELDRDEFTKLFTENSLEDIISGKGETIVED
jgi:hypothetical protein